MTKRPASGAVLAAEANRGRVVVKPVESNAEAPGDGDDDLSEQRCAVDIEKPVECAPDAVIAQRGDIHVTSNERSGTALRSSRPRARVPRAAHNAPAGR